MPAILPSGSYAQVNPLFRAAPSASLLAGWHASKTRRISSGRGNSFLYLAQEISSTQTATVGRNLPEPAELLQHLPLLHGSVTRFFFFLL